MNALREFITAHPRLAVLTGAGVSTDSGIPDYRDADGAWKRVKPVEFRPFMTDPRVRQRYWARSMIGWPAVRDATPNGAHRALAALEARGRIHGLITQNVDGLHARAGSHQVIELHGRLEQVRCMSCEHRLAREDFQRMLVAANPAWTAIQARVAPDGDADIDRDFAGFVVPGCPDCDGVLKPDVVFFGEAVPRERVEAAFAIVAAADALLVVGTSLMVYSGYRFADAAARAGKPIAALNLGRTRADPMLTHKIVAPCQEAFEELMATLPA